MRLPVLFQLGTNRPKSMTGSPLQSASAASLSQGVRVKSEAGRLSPDAMSPRSTLDHLFQDKIGHSIGREILDQRLRRAKRLLKDETVKLNAIAKACGFCNASYFTNTFRPLQQRVRERAART